MVQGLNMKTKKKEEVLDPIIEEKVVNGHTKYNIRGHGKDGTPMYVIIGKDTLEKELAKGVKKVKVAVKPKK
jgi:hypothetical protein